MLEEFSMDNLERKVSAILKTIWVDFVDQLWRCRNDIAHLKLSLHKQQEEETWASRLQWFLCNADSIAHTDQFLLNYPEEDIDKMSGFIRRTLVRNLETV